MKKMFRRLLGLILVQALVLPAALASGNRIGSVYTGSMSKAQKNNIELTLSLLDEVTILPGETFSFNDAVGPRSKKAGFRDAVNGRGVKVIGGGVAQVASAIWLAVKDIPDVEITAVSFYGSKYVGDYVESGSDAVLVDYGKKDFAFRNDGDETLTLTFTEAKEKLECRASFSGGVLLASASFELKGTYGLKENVALASEAVDGTELKKGEEFSFNDIVGPRTKEAGYYSAINGRGVKVTGGGVAQVASVIWLCIKQVKQISVTEKSTYANKYTQDYVESASDAILTDYSSGTDFCFRNIGKKPLKIRVFIDGKMLTCELYETSETGSGSGGVLVW